MTPSIQWVTQEQRGAAVRLLQAQYDEHGIELSSERLDSAVAGMIEMPERGALLIALDGDEPVGLAVLSYAWTLEHGGRVAWLDELYVVPPKREEGLGTVLLARAREVAVGLGCNAIELEVDAEHRRAERLYQRAGFQPLARSRWSLDLQPSRATSPGHRPPASLDHISLGVNDLARAQCRSVKQGIEKTREFGRDMQRG